jgi:hypothetical protein
MSAATDTNGDRRRSAAGRNPDNVQVRRRVFLPWAASPNIKSFYLDDDFTANLEVRRLVRCRDRRAAE